MHRHRPFAVAVLGILLAACAASFPQPQTVYIVRHAEKGDGANPALTARGQARAEALAELLAGRNITRIYSTDTVRTRSTVEPLARRLGIAIDIYDHRRGAELVEAIRTSGENALIVGHSNTIGELAGAFGIDAGAPVDDGMEFDRMYVIRLADEVTGEVRRYGE